MADTTLLLVNMGADPALRNAEGKTAAEIARDNGSSSVVQILQEHAAGK
jgi:ankyrin repeat protein